MFVNFCRVRLSLPCLRARSRSPSSRSMMSPVIEYPEDLNPFAEFEDQPTEDPKPEEEYPQDLNPFGDDDSNDKIEASKVEKENVYNPFDSPEASPKVKLRSQSMSCLGTSYKDTPRRKKSRKSYRAPDPPAGVRPFSLIIDSNQLTTSNVWKIE